MNELHRFNSLKILVHADRLAAVARDEWPYPLDWHIYPSNKCNHSCDWCMFRQNNEQFDNPVKLSSTVLKQAVNDAEETGAKLVHFSGGGEPLLNRFTLMAIEQARSLGLSVALSTNGRLLTPEIVKSVNFVRVSLNAGTKEQHDRTNHAGSNHSDWHLIIESIRTSLPYKLGDLGLAFVVDQDNLRDILPFCALGAELGVDFVHIRPAFWYDKVKDQELRCLMPNILNRCNEAKVLYGDRLPIYSITDKFDGYWSPRTYNKCLAIRTGVCLTATGDFAVCQDRTDLRFGATYKEGKPFREIWGSTEHRAVADKIVAGDELDRCPRCVWNKRNEIIEYAFKQDSMRFDMI